MEKKRVQVYNGDELDVNDVDSKRYLTVNSCGLHSDSHQHTIRRRGRRDWQLIYVEKGEMTVNEGGVTHTLTPGGFIIFSPGEPQDYINRMGVSYWVHFTGTAVEELLEDVFLKGVRLYQGRRHEPAVGRAFEKMIVHFASYSPLQEATLCSDFTALLLEISRLVQSAGEVRCDDRIRSVILSMNRNFKHEVDLEEYARTVGVSGSRFMHLFKESVGMSPYAYVLHLRLTRASDLLLASEAPISEIAFSVGFSDPLYFSRAFKKAFGQSPDLYRKTKS